jgi:D-alanyl-D-alanine carboxypeptidase
MRKWVVVAQFWIVGVLIATWAGEAANAPPPRPFPNSDAGRVAAEWIEAYNGDDEAARAFFRAHYDERELAERSLDDRLGAWHRLRSDLGTLEPVDATARGDAFLAVRATNARGDAVSLGFEFDTAAPHRFRGVRVDVGGPEEPPAAEAGTGPLTEEEAVERLGDQLDSLAQAGAFSGVALLAKGDRPLFLQAYGMADREAKRPNLPDTKFNLGSINKMFTQVAVYQLAERGRLRLDETIDHYLADYPEEKGSKITVRMLLEHRGGTGDIFNERYEKARKRLRTTRDWYRHVRDQALDFEPGSRRAYSNAGYVLLGQIVSAVSGEDYDDYVRDHIFRPAGMGATASYALEEKTPGRAVGYTRGSDHEPEGGAAGAIHRNTDTLPARGSAAGGGYSTAGDLARFATALRNETILGPEYSRAMLGRGYAGGSPGVNATFDVLGPYTLIVLANVDPPIAERVSQRARASLRRLEGAGPADGPAGEPAVAAARAARPDEDGPLARPKRSFLPAAGVDVPMTTAGHLPAVEVLVNGKGPYRFAIDTGGSGALRLDERLVKELGLHVVGEVWGGDPSGQNRRRMDVVAVDSVSIGGATFVRMDASTRSYERPAGGAAVDGVIGFGLFSGSTVTFDYPAGRLRIERGELPAVNGDDVLAYTDEDGVPSITIEVDSLTMRAHVDAGSMGGFVLPERLLERLPLGAEPTVIGRARTVSNTFEIKGAPLRGTLRIGGLEFLDPPLEFQPIMPDANVGSRILKNYRVSFDTRNKRIRFARAS